MSAVAASTTRGAGSMHVALDAAPTTAAALDALLDTISRAIDDEESTRPRALLAEALERSMAPGLGEQRVRALVLAANLADRSADFPTGARHASQALSLARALGDPVSIAWASVASAAVSLSVGDLDAAFHDLEAALPIATSSDREASTLRFHVQNRLGIAYANTGDPAQATTWYERALETATRLPARRFRLMAAGNIAGMRLETAMQRQATGEHEAARPLFVSAVQMLSDAADRCAGCGFVSLQLSLLTNVGVALVGLGRSDDALATFGRVQVLARTVGRSPSLVFAATSMARIHVERGALEEAREVALQGIELGESLGCASAMEDLYDIAFQIEERRGDDARALHFHKKFHAVKSRAALERAKQRAEVLAIRLDTEQARGEARQERLRALSLLRSNEELVERAHALRRQTQLDPLTGLANRRHLDAELARMHDAARGASRPLCALMLDVDHFKQVNDRHSHLVGDAVLREVADILQSHGRATDLVGRYGGEEFLVVFADIDMAAADAACERMRAAVEDHDWTRLSDGLGLTVSGGLCDLAATADVASGLGEADRLLYAAKAAGRNRVASSVRR